MPSTSLSGAKRPRHRKMTLPRPVVGQVYIGPPTILVGASRLVLFAWASGHRGAEAPTSLLEPDWASGLWPTGGRGQPQAAIQITQPMSTHGRQIRATANAPPSASGGSVRGTTNDGPKSDNCSPCWRIGRRCGACTGPTSWAWPPVEDTKSTESGCFAQRMNNSRVRSCRRPGTVGSKDPGCNSSPHDDKVAGHRRDISVGQAGSSPGFGA